MLPGGPEHPKVRSLAFYAGVKHLMAVGIWESLLHWTGQYAPDGNLGRYEPATWAGGIRWEGSPAKLKNALVKARLLDVMEGGALLVHHWDEHSPDAIHMKLARSRLKFASGAFPRFSRIEKTERDAIIRDYAEKWPIDWEKHAGACARGGHAVRTGGAQETPDGASRAHGKRTPSPPLPSPPLPSPPNPRGVGVAGGDGEWDEERFLLELKATGKFPNLTVEGVQVGVKGWKDWRTVAGDVVVEAANLGDTRVGSPTVWISRRVGDRLLPKKENCAGRRATKTEVFKGVQA